MLRDGVEVRMLGSTVDGHLNPTLSTPFVKTASGRRLQPLLHTKRK
jgi:hypothetical protein